MAALHIIHIIARIKRRIAVVVNRDVGLAGVIRRGYSPPLFGMNCSRTNPLSYSSVISSDRDLAYGVFDTKTNMFFSVSKNVDARWT
jgi:hypothetical protein